MKQQMLAGTKMPFCPGCGHGPSVRSISKALINSGYAPHNVIIVSDIGCNGLVDPLFNTHTIHGLHGRSPALGMGVSMGLSDPGKKVVVIQGDGGATIGLQHLLEAARWNVDLTLIVLNNLVYGMTGGQISGLSTSEFKEERHVEDNIPPMDICRLTHVAGAQYIARITSPKNFTHRLEEAFKTPGFSMVEISSLCQPYGVAKMKDLECLVQEDVILRNERDKYTPMKFASSSLLDIRDILPFEFKSNVDDPVGIVIAGSAGGGVQTAAKLLAGAGILCGLHVTMKGEYPVTVGTGYSAAEVILSNNKINYTGLESPDVVIVVSPEGLLKVKDRISSSTTLIFDISLRNGQKAFFGDFIKIAGKKGAALRAISFWLNETKILPLAALREITHKHKYAEKLTKIVNLSTELEMA